MRMPWTFRGVGGSTGYSEAAVNIQQCGGGGSLSAMGLTVDIQGCSGVVTGSHEDVVNIQGYG